MADGSNQTRFPWPNTNPAPLLGPNEIVIDFFSGGGGASEALRQALGRDPDIAVNHDPDALAMHAANHPLTRHMEADVWTVDILREVDGRPVGWFHASPDCTHFSQAKGGQPRSRATRSLSWVIVKVAGILARHKLAPRIISLENVRQILQWGPLVAKRDKATGRVVKIDDSVAEPGERVPLAEQYLVPDKRRAGQTWRQFVRVLQRMGYHVEWRRIRACDYGAGTSRERLFMVACRDREAICWPDPTHGPARAKPYVTAADCIDWSIPCPSIFTRKRPLADATCRRLAKGIHRYVLDTAEPFIVQCANASANGVATACAPLGTITAKPRGGTHAVVAPHLVKFRGASAGSNIAAPVPTITSGAGAKRPAGAAHALGLMTAFLDQANGGGPRGNPARSRGAHEPVSAITASGSQQRVVTCTLSPDAEAGALRVAAFLMRYHSSGGQWVDCREPLTAVTTRDRLALVTVVIGGTPYVIVDIGLRMLTPVELYRAQGFPADYLIDRGADGRKLTKSAQVRMVGNSVSPPPLAAIVRANVSHQNEVAAA